MKKLPLLLLLLLLTACARSTQDEDTTPPAPPQFTTRGSDTLQVESGIDAAANGIFLEWDFGIAPPTDLLGVQLYRSPYPDSAFQPLEEFGAPLVVEATATSYIDNSPALLPLEPTGPLRHWYFLRAVDNSGNLSGPSDTASYRLWYPPENIELSSDGENYNCHIELYSLDLSITGVLVKLSDGHFFRCITLAEQLLQVMDFSLPLSELQPVHPDSVMLRVDILVQDEIAYSVPSNPDGYPLSGSESNWKRIEQP
ncbi:MAG: hypothetical protein ISR91_03425 [Candidatus Delongbacteria bacterium]|nr:hypothetical protein [Candidatus Delongbacteria bacterium]